MTLLSEAVTKYGGTAFGLAIGTAAKYGLAITEGRRLTWLGVLADLLLLGILGLIALVVSDLAGLAGNARVLVGALSAVSSDRIVKLLRARFEQRVTADFFPTPTKDVRQDVDATPQRFDPRVDPHIQPLVAHLRDRPLPARSHEHDQVLWEIHRRTNGDDSPEQ